MLGRVSRLLTTHPRLRRRLGACGRGIAAPARWLPFVAVACGLPASLGAPAAFAQPIFGQNKIQYADFAWQVMATPHLDLHFYPDERELAEWVAKVGEEAVVELMGEMEIDPAKFKKKIPLIVYSTHHDFQQSNISPGIIPEEVGGLTDLIKGRVLVPHTGSYHRLRWVVRHELVHALMLEKISSSLREHKKTRFGYPPLWYVEGLAEFLGADGWDSRADMVLRDAVLNDYLVRIPDLWQINGTFLMYKEGQSILLFIEREYGRDKVIEFLSSWWETGDFAALVPKVLNMTEEDLDKKWAEDLKQYYFPQVKAREPVVTAAVPLVEAYGFNLAACPLPARPGAPASVAPAADTAVAVPAEGAKSASALAQAVGPLELVHLSSIGGFAGVRRSTFKPGREAKHAPEPELLVKGGTSEKFESLHFFASALDVNARREVVLVSKAGERDVLHILQVDAPEAVSTLSFPSLVGLSSPTWSPDGESIVVSGVTEAGNRDLYRVRRDGTELTPLTQDCYDDRDPDWSPDGTAIVFSSDRCPGGAEGAMNLYRLELATGELRALTQGPFDDAEPSYSPDGREIAFRSDRTQGTDDLYILDAIGQVIPCPRFQTAAINPEWTPDGRSLIFTSFIEQRFAIFGCPAPRPAAAPQVPPAIAGTSEPIVLASLSADPPETLAPVPAAGPYAARLGPEEPQPAVPHPAAPHPAAAGIADPPAPSSSTWSPAVPDTSYPINGYRRRFGLDLIAGGVAFDPDFGGGGGGQLAFSDLLGNEQIFVAIANEGGGGGGRSFLQSFDVGLTYLNQSRRLNWGVGGFRLARTYNADLDVFRYETRTGGVFLASYPLNRFHRVETSLTVRRISDHLYRSGMIADTYFVSNVFSYVHDTTLWSMVGPFDGTRYNLAVGLTTDIGAGIGDYTSFLADYRNYHRLPGGVVYAFRLNGRFSFGDEGQRHYLGGAYTIRGYGRRSVYGTRVGLMNHELRFPIVDRLVLRMPMGPFDLPVIYGSLFMDAAWTGDPEWARRPVGAVGAGFFIGGGPFPRIRVDFARVSDFYHFAPYWDTEFSVGFNY